MRELIIDLLDLWFTVSDTDLVIDDRDGYWDSYLMDQLQIKYRWMRFWLILDGTVV